MDIKDKKEVPSPTKKLKAGPDDYIFNLDTPLAVTLCSILSLGWHKTTNKQVVVKRPIQKNYEYNDENKIFDALEARKQKGLPIDNIVIPIMKNERSENNVYQIMEYYEGGSLALIMEEMKAIKRWFRQEEKVSILQGIFKAMIVLKEEKITHNDIAERNVLIRSVAGVGCKVFLADFGRSKIEQDQDAWKMAYFRPQTGDAAMLMQLVQKIIISPFPEQKSVPIQLEVLAYEASLKTWTSNQDKKRIEPQRIQRELLAPLQPAPIKEIFKLPEKHIELLKKIRQELIEKPSCSSEIIAFQYALYHEDEAVEYILCHYLFLQDRNELKEYLKDLAGDLKGLHDKGELFIKEWKYRIVKDCLALKLARNMAQLHNKNKQLSELAKNIQITLTHVHKNQENQWTVCYGNDEQGELAKKSKQLLQNVPQVATKKSYGFYELLLNTLNVNAFRDIIRGKLREQSTKNPFEDEKFFYQIRQGLHYRNINDVSTAAKHVKLALSVNFKQTL